jgi:hypothetical protein
MKLCKENFYKKLTLKELTVIDCHTPTFSDESFNVIIMKNYNRFLPCMLKFPMYRSVTIKNIERMYKEY